MTPTEQSIVVLIWRLPKGNSSIFRQALKNCGETPLRLQRIQDKNRIRQFVFGRYVLRQLVAQMPSSSTQILYNRYGKPRFKRGPRWSLSHSGDWLVLAIGGARAVGVDIESRPLRKPIGVVKKIVYRYADNSVQSQFEKLIRQKKNKHALDYFYKFWVLFESEGKMRGRGISAKISTLARRQKKKRSSIERTPKMTQYFYRCPEFDLGLSVEGHQTRRL